MATAENKPTVVLHQLKRGKFTPCVSPFALKLETYLRMAGISYRVSTFYRLLLMQFIIC